VGSCVLRNGAKIAANARSARMVPPNHSVGERRIDTTSSPDKLKKCGFAHTPR